MTDTELHVSERLSSVLRPLTDEEKADLRKNILEAGRIRDAILYWWDGKRNVIIDGNHRYEIARGEGLEFKTEPVIIEGGYDAAELWIIQYQLGKRNITHDEIRLLRGELYNRLKRKDGGHGNQRSEGQNVPPIRNAAQQVAEKTGVDQRTVKRDGARVSTLEKCTEAVQKGIKSGAVKATDKEIETLATLEDAVQNTVVGDVRKGREATISDAIISRGIKTPKAGKKKPPVKELPPKELEAAQAKAQVKIWAETIGRWLSQSPSIDEYRGKWPGKDGDRVVKAATELFEALKNWRGIK